MSITLSLSWTQVNDALLAHNSPQLKDTFKNVTKETTQRSLEDMDEEDMVREL
jgi:hypothetical protein